jgi:hypothetical protein
MRKRALLARLAFLVVLLLGLGGSEAKACWQCVGGDCQAGGDGINCHEAHFQNGSGVCWTIDGCIY